MISLQKDFDRIEYYLPGQGIINVVSLDEDLNTMMQEFHELNSEEGPKIRKICFCFDYYMCLITMKFKFLTNHSINECFLSLINCEPIIKTREREREI